MILPSVIQLPRLPVCSPETGFGSLFRREIFVCHNLADYSAGLLKLRMRRLRVGPSKIGCHLPPSDLVATFAHLKVLQCMELDACTIFGSTHLYQVLELSVSHPEEAILLTLAGWLYRRPFLRRICKSAHTIQIRTTASS